MLSMKSGSCVSYFPIHNFFLVFITVAITFNKMLNRNSIAYTLHFFLNLKGMFLMLHH